MKFFELFKQFLPTILDLFKYFLSIGDSEFETISQTWPAPIKMSVARLRFEAKLIEEFPDESEKS